MKRLFLFLVIACLSTASYAVVFPTVEQVATKLYANYSVREMESGQRIQYQKKKDGWHVTYAVYNDSINKYEVEKEQLYWSAAIGKYKNLTLFPTGQTGYSSTRVATDLRYANVYDFERCPYYGYDGWDEDVIADYAGYTGTNDTIYEGLARAYSNFGQGYTNHHYAYHLPVPSHLTEKERTDIFIENEKKAIAVYDAMRKRNPHFEVLVGAVTTKYCNEIMATYDDLLYHGREAELKSYFAEDLYDPFMLSIARNMLESCGQNGILFTNGDNDSYPLWYLQWIKGVRTDVAVMNISLMNTGYYLSRFRNGFQKVPPVRMSVSESIYGKETYFDKGEAGSTQKIQASEFGEQVYLKKTDGVERGYFHPCTIVIHNTAPSSEYDLSTEDSATIKLDQNYYRQGEMAMIDVVLSNYEKRPVYAAVSIALSRNLESYFFIEGMIRRFIPARERINDSEMSWMGPVASATLFMNNMMKLLASDTASNDPVNRERWVTNIKLSAIYAGDMLVGSDKQSAVKLLNALYSFCPYSGATGELQALDVYSLHVYYKGGDQKAGDALGTALLDYLEKELTGLEEKRPLSNDDQKLQARDESALPIAKKVFDEYQRAALSARTQKLMDRF